MKIKFASIALAAVATAATLVNGAPADTGAAALERRDVPGSLGNIISRLGELGQRMDQVVGSTATQWQGPSKDTALRKLNDVLGLLSKTRQATDQLESVFSAACANYHNCNADIPY